MQYVTTYSIIIAILGWSIDFDQNIKRNKSQEKLNPSYQRPSITLLIAGDVMTGRGIDQILPHPSNPVLHEGYMKNAKGYVKLAEDAHGPIDKPVDYDYIWGAAIDEFQRIQPDVKLINLETSVTKSDNYWKGKGINYRMHPENIQCLTSVGIDCCTLANNHILDWGYEGLEETIKTLDRAGIKHAGAGNNISSALAPAIMEVPGKGRVVVFSIGLPTSGIPHVWAAKEDKAGVYFTKSLSSEFIKQLRQQVKKVKQSMDIVVVSIHWGSNWGYDIPSVQQHFAHLIIDKADVDIIHGHSSHHFKGIEIYQNKPVIYGAGDFINDYEGISGHDEYRDDLALMYFPTINPDNGHLVKFKLIPLKIRNFQLIQPTNKEIQWIENTLNQQGKSFNTSVERLPNQVFNLKWEKN